MKNTMKPDLQAPSTLPLRRRVCSAAALLALAAGLAACGDAKSPAGAANGAGAGAPPPPEVAVVTVQPGTVQLSTELPGRLEASRVAQVRARATGILLKRTFTEGSDVKAGQTLYQIDAAPYDAALQSAQAQLAQAQAQLAQASATATRYKPLVAANAVSQQEYDAAVAAEKAAQERIVEERSNDAVADGSAGKDADDARGGVADDRGEAVEAGLALDGRGIVFDLGQFAVVGALLGGATGGNADGKHGGNAAPRVQGDEYLHDLNSDSGATIVCSIRWKAARCIRGVVRVLAVGRRVGRNVRAGPKQIRGGRTFAETRRVAIRTAGLRRL